MFQRTAIRRASRQVKLKYYVACFTFAKSSKILAITLRRSLQSIFVFSLILLLFRPRSRPSAAIRVIRPGVAPRGGDHDLRSGCPRSPSEQLVAAVAAPALRKTPCLRENIGGKGKIGEPQVVWSYVLTALYRRRDFIESEAPWISIPLMALDFGWR